MRSLNLSRLARASEATFFKNEQAYQANNLRKSLANNDIPALESTTPTRTPSVNLSSSNSEVSADILPEIAAHSTYRKLVRTASTEVPVRQEPRPLLLRIASTVRSGQQTTTSNTTSKHSGFTDPNLLRVLGSSRFSLYQDAMRMQQSTPAARPLPGSERYAEGSAIGLASLSIATAVVALIGTTGGVILWKHPSIVDSWRDRTVSLRHFLDRHFGEPLRNSLGQHIQNGNLLSEDTRGRATAFARGAIGNPSSQSPGSEMDATRDH